ncbi:MAG: hypothetical protein FD129_1107 [bacterium]|nr:MAG: hypothetical protein FD129_1107 [bacterium]
MDESALLEKLRRIEALFEGATTSGEAVAAEEARGRMLARLAELQTTDVPIEYRFTMADVWSRKLLLALLRRYGLKPYRYRGQRRTTLMVKVSKRFVDEILWEEYQQLSSVLRRHLDEVTERIISNSVHADSSDASEVDAPAMLEGGK